MSAPVVLTLSAVFVLLATAMGALLVALEKPLARACGVRVPHSSVTLAALVLSPLVLGLVGTLALASPDPFSALCHCTMHGLHHPHLCWSHPGLASALVVPAIVVVVVWALRVAPAVFRILRDLVETLRLREHLDGLPVEHVDGVPIRLSTSAGVGAFTVGMFAQVVVANRSLWNELAPDERRALAHHEHAHVIRRDGFSVLALRVGAALASLPERSALLGAWIDAAEATCDRHAADRVGDPAAVAAALVAVARARGAASNDAPAFAMGMAEGDLRSRVIALLDDERRRPASLASDLCAVIVPVAGALVLAIVWPGDIVHHAVETALGLLHH